MHQMPPSRLHSRLPRKRTCRPRRRRAKSPQSASLCRHSARAPFLPLIHLRKRHPQRREGACARPRIRRRVLSHLGYTSRSVFQSDRREWFSPTCPSCRRRSVYSISHAARTEHFNRPVHNRHGNEVGALGERNVHDLQVMRRERQYIVCAFNFKRRCVHPFGEVKLIRGGMICVHATPPSPAVVASNGGVFVGTTGEILRAVFLVSQNRRDLWQIKRVVC